jgi:hypothetical protein
MIPAVSGGQKRAYWIAGAALVALVGAGVGARAGCSPKADSTKTPAGDRGPATGAPGESAPAVAGQILIGTVVDDYGRQVAGAVVEALRMRDGQWAAVATSASDDQGAFRLRELTAGEYEVRARKSGFSDEAVSGVAVPSPPEAPPLELTLERAGVLRGRVVEDNGRPAKGATVMLRDTGAATAPTAVAGEDGTFAINGLPAGVYGAQARLGVFVSAVEDGIELQAGAEAFVELQLAASAVLAGSVVDRATGQPAASARLVFDPGVLGPGGETAPVAADGSFSVAGLRAGSVRVIAEAPGYVPASGLGQAGGAALVIQLDRAATLSGVVLDEAGDPVAGAELEVLAEGVELADTFAGGIALAASDNLGVTVGAVPKIPIAGSAAPMTLIGGAVGAGAAIWQTGPDGTFEIAPVGPGRVRVVAHHAELSPGETRPIEVSAGASVGGLRITLEAGGMLIGEVRDASDAPAAGIAIELQLDAGELRRTTVTDGSGRFELGPVRGSGVVIAHPPGEPAVQAEVEIGPGEDVPVLLRLSGATARITGEVTGSAGQPLIATVVRVRVPDAAPPLTRTAVTDAQGRFAIEGLPLERCRLEVEHPDHAPFAIDVVPGGPPVEVALAEGARIIAEVRDAVGGKPLAGAVMTLRAASGGAPLRGRTDSAGKIEIRSVNIDEYKVIVEHNGFASARLDSVVESADTPTELGVIELMPTGSAAGQVVDRYGSTVAGAEVAAGDPPRWQAAVRSGSDGRFRLAGLAAGELVLTARTRSGSYSEPVSARVESGDESGGLVLRLPSAEDAPEAVAEPEDDDEGQEQDDEVEAEPERPAAARTPPAVAITIGYAQGEVRVTQVLSASAKAAGLLLGDVISAVDGEAVLAASQGRALLRGAAGSVAAIEVVRNGKRVRLRAPREASPGW